MDIDLNVFCDKLDTVKFGEPFSDDKYTYACNGHLTIRIKKINKYDREPPISMIGPLFIPTHKGRWIQFPEYVTPPRIKCRLCRASGKVELCEECNGECEVTWTSS